MGRNTKIEETLNLPSMEDIIVDGEVTEEVDFEDDAANQASLETAVALASVAEQNIEIRNGDGHATAMDELHKETLKHARDLVDLGYNVDQRSAATIFEKATMMYKIAQDAKDSKRKMQLEAMKVMQNMKKLELEERRLRFEMGDKAGETIQAEATIVEDRNELIKRMRDMGKKV